MSRHPFSLFWRLRHRWQMWRSTGDDLNRRVSVEMVLLNAAAGKRPLPDREECRQLAYKLGIPSRYRGDGDRNV